MSAAYRHRPQALDVREWKALAVGALNEAGVRIGEPFIVVRFDEWAEAKAGPRPAPASPRRRLDEPREGMARRTDPETSRRAARDVKPRSGTQRGRLLAVIANSGPQGMTSEEASEAAGVSFSRSSGPRIAELLREGYIRDTGQTRPGSLGSDQRVLVATDKGREILGLDAEPSLFDAADEQTTSGRLLDYRYPTDTRGGPRS